MSRFSDSQFEIDDDEAPTKPGELSANGHWLFGSIFAGLVLIGFGFGVWAGTPKSKPVDAEAKQKDKDNTEKPVAQNPKPQPKPDIKPDPKPEPKPDPKPKEPEPKPKEPDPKPKEPEPKPKEPEPKPKPKDPPTVPVKAVSFKEVRGFLDKHCLICHGNAGKPKAGLDLRTLAAIKKGGDSGEVLVPGDPKKSKLYTSMLPGSDSLMPPDDKPQPTEAEKNLIRDWIAGGAKERRTVRRRRAGRN